MVEIRQKGSGPQATPAHRHYDREPGNGVAEAMPAHRASVRHGRRRQASRSSLRPPASPARGLGDPVHRAHHDRGLQARRPAGSRPASAGVPGTGSGGDRADRQLPGQAGVHPGELRRDQALAQVADQWAAARPGSGPAGQQDDRSAPAGHGPAPGPGAPAAVSYGAAPLRLPARHPQNPGPRAAAGPVICSTHTTVLCIRHAIVSQSVRRSASQKRPPRRSNDGQAILEPSR